MLRCACCFGKDDGERLVEIKVDFEGRQILYCFHYTCTSVGSCRDFPPPHISLFIFSKKLPELLTEIDNGQKQIFGPLKRTLGPLPVTARRWGKWKGRPHPGNGSAAVLENKNTGRLQIQEAEVFYGHRHQRQTQLCFLTTSPCPSPPEAIHLDDRWL